MDTTVSRSEELTVERFNSKQDRIARDFGYGDTAGALAVAKANLSTLKTAVAEKLKKSKYLREDNPKKHFSRVLSSLDTDHVALCAMSTCLHQVAVGSRLLDTLIALGHAIAGECWAAGLLQHNAKLAGAINRAVRQRHGKLKYRKQAARSIAARAGYRQKHWDREQLVAAGEWLLDCVLTSLPTVFELAADGEGEKVLTITPEALEVAEAAVECAIQANPVFLPCTEMPAPWSDWSTGGYWDERSRLRATAVRTIYKETAAAIRGAMKSGAAKPHMDALNSLQSVAFTINKSVLDIVRQCQAKGIEVPGLPAKEDTPMPPKGDWDDMTEQQQQVWKGEASAIKEHNRSLVGERVLFKQDLTVAEMLAQHDRFYTPMNCDWRGRVYAACHFNFQRDDRVRALFMFADGMPIGEEGLRYLKTHVANCGDFGKISKRPIEERIAWTEQNERMLRDCAWRTMNPDVIEIWTKADKPFLFLAACLELAAALAVGATYITRLPVSFDGSCSGLQHLTAMTRAPEGALVNLTDGETPQDVYQSVADRVVACVTTEAGCGSPIARTVLTYLQNNDTRKVAKRNTMTFSYGSKKFGMARQQETDLVAKLDFDVLSGKLDKHPFGEFAKKKHKKSTSPVAKYLGGKVYDAIKATVDLPQQAMVFLQQCARALAHEGKPLQWTTPTGLPWINRYHEPHMKRVELWLHDTRVQVTLADGTKKEIDKEKAANGVAPNFVHALDASHLALSINASVAAGVVQLATVHDSFGCLAPQAKRFNQIIREQFVQMYEQNDVLAQVREQAFCDLTLHNKQRLPEGLQYGSLDIQSVLTAKYAFA